MANDTNTTMELIVEFPQRLGQTGGKRAKKTVHFSSVHEIRDFERHEYEADTTKFWHTRQEYTVMKKRNTDFVRQVHKRYSSSSSRDSLFDGDAEMNGVENLLTTKIIKIRVLYRKQVLDSVLEEQERQYDSGEYDARRLARISKYYSKWTVKRARLIGLLQTK